MRAGILAIFGVALLLVGWVLLFVFPGTRAIIWGVIVLGSLAIAAAAVIDHRRVHDTLTSSRGRFGVGTTIAASLFLGIIVLVNAIGSETYRRFDLTGLSRFTLTSQTRELLTNLETPVEVVSFFTRDASSVLSEYTSSMLTEYADHSSRVTVRRVDPELRPEVARAYGVDRLGVHYGTVVFRGEAGQRQVLGPQIASGAEHAFTSAMLEVTGARQRVVYVLSGHGERSIEDDYYLAATGLRDNLFRVAVVDLAQLPAIPDDATVLIVASPRLSWSQREHETLREFLENGGRLLALFDPYPAESLRRLLSEWWIEIGDGVLVDPGSYAVPSVDNLLITRTRNAFGLTETYLPGATATIPSESLPGSVRLDPLVWTTAQARLQARPDSSGEDRGIASEVGPTGSLAAGALLSIPVPGTRIIAVGDSDFAANENLATGNNAEFFLSMVNWLAEGEQIVSVERRVLVTRRLLLTPVQARFLHFSSIGLLPLLLLLAGAWAWWRRR